MGLQQAGSYIDGETKDAVLIGADHGALSDLDDLSGERSKRVLGSFDELATAGVVEGKFGFDTKTTAERGVDLGELTDNITDVSKLLGNEIASGIRSWIGIWLWRVWLLLIVVVLRILVVLWLALVVRSNVLIGVLLLWIILWLGLISDSVDVLILLVLINVLILVLALLIVVDVVDVVVLNVRVGTLLLARRLLVVDVRLFVSIVVNVVIGLLLLVVVIVDRGAG